MGNRSRRHASRQRHRHPLRLGHPQRLTKVSDYANATDAGASTKHGPDDRVHLTTCRTAGSARPSTTAYRQTSRAIRLGQSPIPTTRATWCWTSSNDNSDTEAGAADLDRRYLWGQNVDQLFAQENHRDDSRHRWRPDTFAVGNRLDTHRPPGQHPRPRPLRRGNRQSTVDEPLHLLRLRRSHERRHESNSLPVHGPRIRRRHRPLLLTTPAGTTRTRASSSAMTPSILLRVMRTCIGMWERADQCDRSEWTQRILELSNRQFKGRLGF